MKNKTAKRNIKAEIEKTDRLSVEQSQQIRRENYTLQIENEKLNQKQKEEIDALNSLNKDLNNKLNENEQVLKSISLDNTELGQNKKQLIEENNKLLVQLKKINTNQQRDFEIYLNKILNNIEPEDLLKSIVKLKESKSIETFIEYYNNNVGNVINTNTVNTFLFNLGLFEDGGNGKINTTNKGKALYFLLKNKINKLN